MQECFKRIKDLPKDTRPREKLLKSGAKKLSDAELLAIILRTGTKGKSVIKLADEVIKGAGGSLFGLIGKDIQELMKITGIKKAKAVTLAAAFEIAHRISQQLMKNAKHVLPFQLQLGFFKDKKVPIIFRNEILDIPSTTYGVFGIYRYPAKFIPQVIAYVLKNYAEPGDIIFDPFAGYGTVGMVSRIYGYEYELWDLNPLLEVIHSTTMIKPSVIDIAKIISEIKNSKVEFLPNWSNLKYWFPAEFLKTLGKAWGYVHSLKDEKKYLILLPLLKVTKFFSYANEKGYKLCRSQHSKEKIEKLKKSNWKIQFYNTLAKEINFLIRKLREYLNLKPKDVPFVVKAGIDTLEEIPERKFDILITSPPYLQAQEYIRSTKLELFWLGYKENYIRELSSKEIPYRDFTPVAISSKKFYKFREKIKEPHLLKIYDCYFHSLLKTFSTLGERVKKYMFIFVGPAKVRTIPIPIDEIIVEHLENFNWKHEITLVDKILARAMFEAKINPASGLEDSRIKTEHLVILKKC